MSSVAPLPVVRGRVAAFDEHRGLGEVETVADGVVLAFHCTAVADGSRSIAPGAVVDFRVVTGPIGILEAAELRPA